jgi:hypothetical protein
VSTTEELLGRKSSDSGKKTEEKEKTSLHQSKINININTNKAISRKK